MPGEERTASSPLAGGLRDAVRTFVAFVVAFLFVKLGALVPGVDLASAQEAIVVIVTSGILAMIGKVMRDKGMPFGKIV
jgi:hypothetical protein